DGWTPAPIPVQSRDAGGGPVANPVPAGYIDYPQLAPGIGYCLRPGMTYPYGYFTRRSSCRTGTTERTIFFRHRAPGLTSQAARSLEVRCSWSPLALRPERLCLVDAETDAHDGRRPRSVAARAQVD